MLAQLSVGAGASICCITVHSLMMAVVLRVARSHARIRGYSSVSLSWVMSSVVCVLMAAHALEVMIWTLLYKLVGVAPAGSDLLYFAFVNYTTLGYGDIMPVARWRLLGPAAAMNGILLFGWSTAVIFEVLRRILIRMDGIAH
ncbi:potassium channel family protein [Methylobacterium phyllosphaerae]